MSTPRLHPHRHAVLLAIASLMLGACDGCASGTPSIDDPSTPHPPAHDNRVRSSELPPILAHIHEVTERSCQTLSGRLELTPDGCMRSLPLVHDPDRFADCLDSGLASTSEGAADAHATHRTCLDNAVERFRACDREAGPDDIENSLYCIADWQMDAEECADLLFDDFAASDAEGALDLVDRCSSAAYTADVPDLRNWTRTATDDMVRRMDAACRCGDTDACSGDWRSESTRFLSCYTDELSAMRSELPVGALGALECQPALLEEQAACWTSEAACHGACDLNASIASMLCEGRHLLISDITEAHVFAQSQCH